LADEQLQDEQQVDGAPEQSVESALDPVDLVRSGWRDLWQIPMSLAAIALLVAALGYAFVTKPDPDFSPAFKVAAKQIEREEYPQAIKTLNTRILPYVGKPVMTDRQEGHFYQLLARAVFGGQKAMGISNETNYRNALSAMRKAEADGTKLTDKDQALIAQCYLALGEIESASARAEQITGESADIKLRITRRIVDKHLAANPPRYDDASDLLAEMLDDSTLSVDDRAWAIGRQAQIEIAQNLPEVAITRLLRAMPRMASASPLPRARLQLLLAKAYLEGLATDQANLQLDLAAKLIPDGSPEQAEANLLRARVSNNARITTPPEISTLKSLTVSNQIMSEFGLSSVSPSWKQLWLSMKAHKWSSRTWPHRCVRMNPKPSQSGTNSSTAS